MGSRKQRHNSTCVITEGTDVVRTQENEYRIADFDETDSTTHYYGYINEVGGWLIMREKITGNIRSYRYARVSFASRGTYDENWQDRTTLEYGHWDERF